MDEDLPPDGPLGDIFRGINEARLTDPDFRFTSALRRYDPEDMNVALGLGADVNKPGIFGVHFLGVFQNLCEFGLNCEDDDRSAEQILSDARRTLSFLFRQPGLEYSAYDGFGCTPVEQSLELCEELFQKDERLVNLYADLLLHVLLQGFERGQAPYRIFYHGMFFKKGDEQDPYHAQRQSFKRALEKIFQRVAERLSSPQQEPENTLVSKYADRIDAWRVPQMPDLADLEMPSVDYLAIQERIDEAMKGAASTMRATGRQVLTDANDPGGFIQELDIAEVLEAFESHPLQGHIAEHYGTQDSGEDPKYEEPRP